MTTLRSGAEELRTPRIHVDARTVAIALAAALAVALTALVIVLATSSSGGAEPVRVAPTSSGPIPPSAAERDQPAGLNGPGARP
jgi:hypothetical protein